MASRRHAIVGVGARSILYQDALHQRAAAGSPERGVGLVACADVNAGRLELARVRACAQGQGPPATYAAGDFRRMLEDTRPDVVIVTTPDWTHADYVTQALNFGADVVVEKPMATTAEDCQRILDAVARSGRRCTVTFNYRYSPVRSQVAELLRSRVIGDVLSVDFHWMLDTRHGADYFRRWHSHKRHSGGLIVHKATHHFDLVNWWLGSAPERVWAHGKRQFYQPGTARRLGLSGPHERCHGCAERRACKFAIDLAADPELGPLYLAQEAHDGYIRDRCVFRPDIDIEDTLNVIVEYASGATLCYSLNAFCSWEGYTVVFNGSHGRLEHGVVESTNLSPEVDARGAIRANGAQVRVYPLRGEPRAIEPRPSLGGHGGGDALMLDDVLGPSGDGGGTGRSGADPLRRSADQRSGAHSILIGVAANRSMQTGAAVRIGDLVQGLEAPEWRA